MSGRTSYDICSPDILRCAPRPNQKFVRNFSIYLGILWENSFLPRRIPFQLYQEQGAGRKWHRMRWQTGA